MNRLFNQDFKSEEGPSHVTENSNIFTHQDVVIIDAVGGDDVNYEEFEHVRIVYLCGGGRIGDEAKQWKQAHPTLKDNVMLVRGWQHELLFKQKDVLGWKSHGKLMKEDLLHGIPLYKKASAAIAKASSPKSSTNNALKENTRANFQVPMIQFELFSPKSLQTLEADTIACLDSLKTVKDNRLIGDCQLKTVCILYGFYEESGAWSNDTVYEFMKCKMPEVIKHIEELYKDQGAIALDLIMKDKFVDGFEAVIGLYLNGEQGRNKGKKNKNCSKSLTHAYIDFLKARRPEQGLVQGFKQLKLLKQEVTAAR